jgi:hypothetical protein
VWAHESRRKVKKPSGGWELHMRRDPSEGPRHPMSACHVNFGVDTMQQCFRIFFLSRLMILKVMLTFGSRRHETLKVLISRK